MPRVSKRKQRAAELLSRLEKGPGFSDVFHEFDPKEAERQYKLWSSTWVLDELKQLVPELKKRD